MGMKCFFFFNFFFFCILPRSLVETISLISAFSTWPFPYTHSSASYISFLQTLCPHFICLTFYYSLSSIFCHCSFHKESCGCVYIHLYSSTYSQPHIINMYLPNPSTTSRIWHKVNNFEQSTAGLNLVFPSTCLVALLKKPLCVIFYQLLGHLKLCNVSKLN